MPLLFYPYDSIIPAVLIIGTSVYPLDNSELPEESKCHSQTKPSLVRTAVRNLNSPLTSKLSTKKKVSKTNLVDVRNVESPRKTTADSIVRKQKLPVHLAARRTQYRLSQKILQAFFAEIVLEHKKTDPNPLKLKTTACGGF
jgi:hypothetical protein